MKTSLAPRFSGQQPFGAQKEFRCSPLVGGPASIDAWLGNQPGTTDGPAQQSWGLSGQFVGPTQAAVQAQLDGLAGLAGVDSAFGFPTGSRLPGDNFRWGPRPCYFLPAEFVPGTVTPSSGRQFAATFRLVMRST